MLQAQIFLDEGDKGPDAPLYEYILRYLMKSGLKGATLFRADFGFGSRQQLHAPSRFGGLDERPIMITFIDVEKKVLEAIIHIKPLLKDGLLATQFVEVW